MRKRPLTRPVAVAAIALLLLCAGVYQVSAADYDDTITTTLHPGWNLIGWIHEAAPASELFGQLDELNLIHDGDERSLHRGASDDPADLQTLEPGRGYWFHINSERPIDWTRAAEPVTRRFHLEPGEQLVAWAGPSDRSISDVLLGLRDQLTMAWRWIAAEQRFVPWSPNPDLPALDMPAIDRGEAVQVNLTEAAEWLHPTGALPRIQFPGGLHDEVHDDIRERIQADLRFVVERYAATFGIEVPADRVRLLVPTTHDAVERLRGTAATTRDAWAWAKLPGTRGGVSQIVVPRSLLDYDDDPDSESPEFRRGILAHEYFHVLQYELAGASRSRVPGWLSEGTAIWADITSSRRARPEIDYLHTSTGVLDLQAHHQPFVPNHNLGMLAVALLIERAGVQSIVDFWRYLGLRANSNRSWQAAFAQAFGITFADFAAEFYEERRSSFGTIDVRLHELNGRSMADFYLRSLGWWPLGSEDFGHVDHRVDVASDGTVSLHLLRTGPGTTELARYTLILGRDHSSCRAQLTRDGTLLEIIIADYNDDITIPTAGPSSHKLDAELPAGFCRHRFTVRLFGDYVASQLTFVLVCRPEGGRCIHLRSSGTAGFREFVPFPGDYSIRIYDSGVRCGAYVAEGGYTEDRASATQFASGDNAPPLRVRLDSAEDLCSPDDE